jgi:hypothetical protein
MQGSYGMRHFVRRREIVWLHVGRPDKVGLQGINATLPEYPSSKLLQKARIQKLDELMVYYFLIPNEIHITVNSAFGVGPVS